MSIVHSLLVYHGHLTPPVAPSVCRSFRHKSLGTVMTLFNSLVKLKVRRTTESTMGATSSVPTPPDSCRFFDVLLVEQKLKMRVIIPKTEAALEVAMRGLTGPYPEAEDITLIIGPEVLARNDMT